MSHTQYHSTNAATADNSLADCPIDKLLIGHFNAKSVNNKGEQIKNFITQYKFHIFCINETWFTNKSKFKHNDYVIIRKDRDDKHGGVCICVHKSISFVDLKPALANDIEAIVLRFPNIVSDNKDLIVASYYNTPDTRISAEFLEYLNLMSSQHHVLLIGDLNAHNIEWRSKSNNTSGIIIEKFLCETQFIMLNTNEFTYVSPIDPSYKSIIDLALVSSSLTNKVSNFVVTDELHSDHNTISLQIDAKLPKINEQSAKLINWDKFGDLMKKRAIKFYNRTYANKDDIDNFIVELTGAIQGAINEASFTKKMNNNTNLYILPKHILNLIREKRKIRKKYLKSGDLRFKTTINQLNSMIKKLINKHKSDKWKNFCNSINGMHISDSKLWKKLRSIEKGGEPTHSRNPTLVVNGIPVNDSTKTSNAFADSLESIFQDIDDPEYDAKHKKTVINSNKNLFNEMAHEPNCTNEFEISRIIKNIRGRGAPGIDKITNKVIKQLPSIYHDILAQLYNACLKLSYFPDAWKVAVIVMIPKPNKDHTLVDNYRPISLLNTLGKLFERVIASKMEDWIIQNKILVNYQSGFRRRFQTKDQIFRLIQSCLAGFNRCHKIGTVFIDIQKAFDSVWHAGLLHKLDKLKIPSYLGKIIQCYLNNRKFMVKVGDIYSTIRAILSGVPQGSVLGPILFLLFFNDIPCNDKTIPALFADDLSLWYSHGNLRVINNRLQSTLDKIKLWLSTWRLKLNVSKTTYVVFNRNGVQHKLSLYYGNAIINYERNPKFLGVILDPALTFREHIRCIRQRSASRINLLKSIRGRNWGANEKLLMITYKVLIRSLIDYCPFIPILASNSNYIDIERIQRKALKIALRLPYSTPITQIYEKACLPDVIDRATTLTLKFLTKAAKYNEPVKTMLNDYKIAGELDEGLFSKVVRVTLLGKLRELSGLSIENFINSLI